MGTETIKEMAALFLAYDRPHYSRLIPHHLQELLTIPDDVLSSLKQGFTVSLKGRAGHSVTIDEAHEMCINRQCKEGITKPSADYINRTAWESEQIQRITWTTNCIRTLNQKKQPI